MSNDEDIEDIRQRKMEELRQRAQEQQQEEMERQQQEAEAQKKAILRQYLSSDARRRLNTVRMSKPELAQEAEKQILALVQSGRLNEQIDEEQMKEILKKLQPDDDGFNIRRR